jgi:hypothetical protein
MATGQTDRIKAVWTVLLGFSTIITLATSVLQASQVIGQKDISALAIAIGILAGLIVFAVFLDQRRRVRNEKAAEISPDVGGVKKNTLFEKIALTLTSLSLIGMAIALGMSTQKHSQQGIGSQIPSSTPASTSVAPSTDPGRTPTAPTSPSASPAAQVEISQPGEGAAMQAGQDVPVAGNIVGLGGDTLWIVLTPDAGGRYYLTQGSPVADHDGPWRSLASQVGDSSDKGHNIVFKALQANRSCSVQLAAVRPEQGSLVLSLLPDSCVVRAQRAVAVVR